MKVVGGRGSMVLLTSPASPTHNPTCVLLLFVKEEDVDTDVEVKMCK